MRRAAWLVAAFLFGLSLVHAQPAKAPQGSGVNWIWLNEGDPAANRPAETVYFRRAFVIDRPVQKVVDEGTLDITADNAFTVWLNGVEIGKGTAWQQVYSFDVMKHLVNGKNVLAVKATNTEPSPAGLLVRLGYVPNGQDRRALASDAQWKAIKDAPEGWQKPDFDDSKWPAVKVIGPYGKSGPWRNVAWQGGGDERFTVPEGFTVELAVKNPNLSDNFSLVNMCFDAKGRLLVSREGGAILLCTEPDEKGVLRNVKPYCEQVKNCQGMCWVKDALLLVGDGPQGTGLYRVKDTNGDDKTDEAQLLHKFKGGMGEHGPHAIIHGPDGWLYVVIGNHAWAQPEKLASNSPLTRWPTGHFGPDQGKPDTTEDVLLPRLNDSRGHAANILAPGGTIWRLDHEGKNLSLVAAGFRNHFDAAFSPSGELFTFDSDMEWDEALPWYRHVRVCHCPPGADFVWRTGAANTPDWYIDSLPPVVETGRGSPVGVEFYDHHAFPEKYRGAFFMADWSIGVIYAVHLKREGASYKGVAERFCVGAPMNVTDLAVAPDGSLYFTLGGRGTQGGVYRIACAKPEGSFIGVQPLSAWGREAIEKLRLPNLPKVLEAQSMADIARKVVAGLDADKITPSMRIAALSHMQSHFGPPDPKLLLELLSDGDPEVRAFAVYLTGVNRYSECKESLLKDLQDKDALVRRRACEALIRANIEPPIEVIWPLLADPDRFVRHAARLVVERMDVKKWADRVWAEKNQLLALNGIIALCHTNQAIPYTDRIFEKLHNIEPEADNAQSQLDYLRTVQMALIHTTARPGAVRGIALECLEHFPNSDWRVNRELAILLTEFRRAKILDEPIHAKLLEALLKAKDDRQQQVHYFYCLRLLHEGWTLQQKDQLLAWFDATKTWTGGHSFMPFLEHILRDLNPIFTQADRSKAIASAGEHPWTAAVLLRYSPADQTPAPRELGTMYKGLLKTGATPQTRELKESIMASLLRDAGKPEVEAMLTELAAADPSLLDQVARNLARRPTPANWPILVRGLQSNNPDALLDIMRALRRLPVKAVISKEPKSEEAMPYRLLLLASAKLPPQQRLRAVELLRHWKDQRFAVEPEDWKGELEGWSRWFAQTFPKEPSLPNVTEVAVQSKWKFAELLPYLESSQGKGDAASGKAIFEKANCIKCHKFGSIGEGLGPDLTTLKSRFKRADTLEALIDPSKVISDQYRGTKILTKDGATITGLAAPQGGMITVLQLDGTKITLKESDIDVRVASTLSAMPEKLLDELTKEQIADLFAYLESEPPK